MMNPWQSSSITKEERQKLKDDYEAQFKIGSVVKFHLYTEYDEGTEFEGTIIAFNDRNRAIIEYKYGQVIQPAEIGFLEFVQ